MTPAAHLTLVTLGVADVARAREFYVEGLGWPVTLDLPGEVCFVQVAHGVLLALWGREALAEDSGAPLEPGAAMALASNVGSEDEVVALLARAEAAGATILKPAQRAFFGGLQGYFADPDGFRWEVAHNPGLTVDPDGTVHLGSAN